MGSLRSARLQCSLCGPYVARRRRADSPFQSHPNRFSRQQPLNSTPPVGDFEPIKTPAVTAARMFVPLQEGVNTGVIDATGWLVAVVGLLLVVGWYYRLTS